MDLDQLLARARAGRERRVCGEVAPFEGSREEQIAEVMRIAAGSATISTSGRVVSLYRFLMSASSDEVSRLCREFRQMEALDADEGVGHG